MGSDDIVPGDKPSLREWLENFLPFRLPNIPFVRTAKNIDIALARLTGATGEHFASRIEAATRTTVAISKAEAQAIQAAAKKASEEIRSGTTLSERALIFTYRDSILKQTNREDIALKACEELARDPPCQDAPDEIALDWLNHFSRYAEYVSSETLRSLWAKILSGEIKRPGTFRITTLQKLSAILTDDANKIHSLLNYVIDERFFYSHNDFISIDIAIRAEQIGLLSMGAERFAVNLELRRVHNIVAERLGVNFERERVHKICVGTLDCHDMRILAFADDPASVQIPAYSLTPFGEDLLKLSSTFHADELYLRTVGGLIKGVSGARVQLLRLGEPDAVTSERPIISTVEL
jgi:hypothetical protein